MEIRATNKETVNKEVGKGEAGALTFKPHTRISMKDHPSLNEKWLQKQIDDDPSILGLGDLIVRDIERQQPRAGRLDMLLADLDGQTRYEVELQLGATDESHIIRVLEYWDNERKRYPQYDHIAVLVAEDITSRFFNVISLFNNSIPIIAIQLKAVKISDSVATLVFTKILDHATLGTDEEDEGRPVHRQYWIKRSSAEMLKLVDKIYKLISESDPGIQLGYRKHYIGLERNGFATNYIKIKPHKSHIVLEFLSIPNSEEVDDLIENANISTLAFKSYTGYRLKLRSGDVRKNAELIQNLIERAKANFKV